MALEIQALAWNRHKNVIGLNCLMGSQPVCQLLAAGCWFSQGTMILSTHKTDHHDIAEILLIVALSNNNHIVIPSLPGGGGGVYCFTSVRLSVLPSVQDIFRRIFLSNYQWQKSDIWSQASYRYAILWEAFLDLSD